MSVDDVRDVTITQKEACDTAHDVMTDAERGLAEERIEEACFCCKQCCELDSYDVTITSVGGPRYPYKPDYAVPPGRTILECAIEKSGGKHKARRDLSDKLNVPTVYLDMLLAGRLAITPDMATRLYGFLGPSVQFWLNAEANYRTTLARLEREKVKT